MIEQSKRLRCPKCGQTDWVCYEEVNIEEWPAQWDEHTQRYEYVLEARSLDIVERRPRCPDDGTKMDVLRDV